MKPFLIMSASAIPCLVSLVFTQNALLIMLPYTNYLFREIEFTVVIFTQKAKKYYNKIYHFIKFFVLQLDITNF